MMDSNLRKDNEELFAVRPWHLRWGATDEEIIERLPGDDIIADAKNQVTQAITINTAPANVWEKLIRIGHRNKWAGSVGHLADTPGFEVDDAETQTSATRDLKVGDLVHCVHIGWRDGEYKDSAAWHIVQIEPNNSLVLHEQHQRGSWAFVLKETDDGHTRLLIRVRGNKPREYGPGRLDYGVFEPAHFILEHNIMVALKKLSEGERQSPLTILPDAGG